MLHLDPAWEILEEIGKSDDKDITRSLFTQSAALISASLRPRYAMLIVKGAAHEDNDVRQAA